MEISIPIIAEFVYQFISICFGLAVAGIGIAAAKWGITELYLIIKDQTEEKHGPLEQIIYFCCIVSLGIPFLFICFTIAALAFGFIPFSGVTNV